MKLRIGETEKLASKTGFEEKYVLQLEFENINIKCGILEFIPKTLAFADYLEILHTNISRELTEAIVFHFGDMEPELKENMKQLLYDWIKEQSLFSNGGVDVKPIFPFYQVDFSYNILKRTRRELREDNPETCEEYEWISYVKKVYQKLIEKMEDEEGEYEKIGITLNYSERFAEFPIVKTFFGKDELDIQKEIVDLVTTIFYGEDTGITQDTYIGGE